MCNVLVITRGRLAVTFYLLELTAPCACKDDIRASAICYICWVMSIDRSVGRPSKASSCHFGGLFYGS